MFTTSPTAPGSASSASMARTTSRTWQKQRVCRPSPNTVMGCPDNACATKFGMTMPYWPV